MRGDLSEMKIMLNTVSNPEHVPITERRIRTVKERVRSIYNMLPFRKIPAMMVVQMVYSYNLWPNVFPPTDGVSEKLSPQDLITGQVIDFKKNCRLEYGAYAQVHKEHNNSMTERTTGEISLRPTVNTQGGHFFTA